MTTVSEEAKEGSSPPVEQEPESTAATRACARASVTPTAPAAPKAATERARAVRRVLTWTADLLDRPESLVHQHPPTLARAREMHHEAAGRHDAPVLRVARLLWGYAHLLLVKPLLNGLEWITETPLRFFGALILAVVLWIWS